MSWLSKFIQSSVAKKLLDLSGKLLVARLGDAGRDLWETAKDASYKAEMTGKSGAEKRQMVIDAIKAKFVGVKQGFAETATQLAWMWVDAVIMESKDNFNGLKSIT